VTGLSFFSTEGRGILPPSLVLRPARAPDGAVEPSPSLRFSFPSLLQAFSCNQMERWRRTCFIFRVLAQKLPDNQNFPKSLPDFLLSGIFSFYPGPRNQRPPGPFGGRSAPLFPPFFPAVWHGSVCAAVAMSFGRFLLGCRVRVTRKNHARLAILFERRLPVLPP